MSDPVEVPDTAIAILIMPAVGVVTKLWDAEMRSGRLRYNLTPEQVRPLAVPGETMAICPSCRASRWYGEGPCGQCGALIFERAEGSHD